MDICIRYSDEIIHVTTHYALTFQHVARVVMDFLKEQNVNILPCHTVPPDLSFRDYNWDETEMEHCLLYLSNRPATWKWA